MSAILNSLSAHTFPILHPILMKYVLKSVVYRALSYKTYLSIGLRSPLTCFNGSFMKIPLILAILIFICSLNVVLS